MPCSPAMPPSGTTLTFSSARVDAMVAPEGGVASRWQNPAAMESTAKRTLVKSPPELWELADDVPRMESWMAGLVGTAQPIAVLVTDREPQRVLAWSTTGEEALSARIALVLAEKGF